MSKHNKTRTETDSMGSVEVPAERYWGSQTQRSLENFKIGNEVMPTELLNALALIKKAAATVNREQGKIDPLVANAIIKAADEVLSGQLDKEFPLVIWQTGSGTQTNMNMNEVLANRATELLNGRDGSEQIHPNDHVNCCQSSNDTFPTAMHIAAVVMIKEQLLPSLEHLDKNLSHKANNWKEVIKIGRTHMQDAVPMTLAQEFFAFSTQIKNGIHRINDSLPRLLLLAQGGTAVGTGLNATKGFDVAIISEISKLTGHKFSINPNKFEGLAAHDALVEASGALNTLAVSLMKISNDIRLLGSGPRTGLNEIVLPSNEPGSSIMPGKVNPTQTESLSQVCTQVMGNHTTISIAGSNGHLQLNTFKPLLIYNLLQTIRLLANSTRSFTDHCIVGLKANKERLAVMAESSLMLVTALTPHIGYDNSAKIAKKAHEEGITLREAALQLNLINAEDFDRWVKFEMLANPN